jgi:hypothetical protein
MTTVKSDPLGRRLAVLDRKILAWLSDGELGETAIRICSRLDHCDTISGRSA